MALAYLLDPVFQIENTAGKPASGGWLEVYVAGSREKYYCASDFDGTLHPFRIELDSLGANIVLADDSQSYDVYVYNRYGGLLMSRYNVSPGNGGGGVSLSTITSTDGSIIVTQTANGVDLRVDSEAPSTLRCSATSLMSDDVFDFSELQRDGQNAFVNNGEVVVNEGWWHYDITARLRWPGNPAENVESEISLYCVNGSDSVSFDRSYGHDETLQLSGEFKSTQDGTAFNVGVNGIPSGMTVDLVDFGIHSIIGNGAGGKYDAGTGIDIDEPNRIISVDFDEVQAKLTAGDGVTIDSNNEISVDTSVIQRALSPGNGISLDSDDNITVKVDGDSITFNGDGELQANFPAQVQSDWTEADSTKPSYIQNKPTNLVQDADYVHTDNNYTDADVAKLSGIAAGAEVNVQSNWTEADTTADSYIQNKPAETTLTAGSNITITESGSTLTIAATAAPQVQADWNEADNTAVDYIKNKPNLARVALTGEYSDLAHTPHIPSATSQLDNDSGFISGSEVPRYQAHADWQASSSEAGYIYNKPFIPTDTSDLYNDSGYITASDVPRNQVQSDWTESDSLTPEYIKNKPSEKSLVAGSNITLTEAADSVTIAATVAAQQQANWTEADSTSVSYIQNKPSLATVATSGSYTDLLNTPDLSLKEDVANKAQSINTSSTTDYPSSKATADFVNSSVSTNTAKFLGNFTLTDLSLTYPATDAQIETALDGYAFSPAPTNNDYVYVEIQDPSTPGVTDVVKRFKYDGANWLYEYSLNNSSFTAAEIAAIDSGVTSTKVTAYDAHVADSDIHVTLSDKSTWNAKQDAISDLATIRSGAAEGATAVQPGDLATVATTGSYDDLVDKPTIPAAQVNSDWNSNSGVSQILNKPTLAAVATTGDYDDLSNKPSIPAAQVNSDWNATSGVSEILNKPVLATVATTGSYNDLSNTPTIPSGSDLVPPYSIPADEGKVLTIGPSTTYWATPAAGGVTDVEVDGVSVVSGGVASITMPTVDQTYNSASTNAQSGTAVAGAIAGVNQVPASTSSDEGKVLTVDSNGDPEWAAGGSSQVQSDWTEDDTTEPSYIQNKPTPKTLTAGTGISITENASTITVANTATPPTVDQSYDASSTHAQSGAAVADAIGNLGTNLSAAQIQALKEALGIDETVLWEDSAGVVLHNGITLSESRLNFEYLRLTLSCQGKSTTPMCYVDIPMDGVNAGSTFQFQMDVPFNNETTATFAITWKVLMSATNTTLQSTTALYWGKAEFDGTSANAGTWTQGSNANVPNIYKVVGVHRIASN